MYNAKKLNEIILKYREHFKTNAKELVIWDMPENEFTISKFIELIKTAIKQNKKIKNEELLEALNLEYQFEIDGDLVDY